MKPGIESQTAVMVCMGRAIAQGTTSEARFSDETAVALLPDEARGRLERFRAGRPKGLLSRIGYAHLDGLSKTMVARTVAVDDAVRAAASSQLVILGAGLDGRAWRMAELRDVTVFEVDHPDSQRQKRPRAAALTQLAREVRFVPVDFAEDSLDEALAAAGHDPTRPTTWIWEGVVMYLALTDIEATLAVVARRSAPGSRLVVVYHSPAWVLHLVGLFVRRVGEPLRSAFTAEAMDALLGRHGFRVTRDRDVAVIGATLAPDVARRTRVIKHLRVAIAERRG